MAESQINNINLDFNNATGGLNLDQTPNQIQKGSLTYALNATIESFDSSSVNYQNEQGNDFCLSFPEGYTLIGKHFISEQSKHIFMLVNPDTQSSEIGYMENNNCKYITLTNASCLNFDINHPIHKIVHKISKERTEIYWTDGKNPRRYINLDDFPKKIKEGSDLCNPTYTDELDCNKIKIQPDFKIPKLNVKEIIGGGNLISGTYQFAIQYCDSVGNPYTSYYSITNPTPIADSNITTQNFNYPVGKSIVVEIDNLDTSGNVKYFNLAVIKTINAITTPVLVGTYNIDNSYKSITYTGQQVDEIRLTINDIFEKFPYYELADDITAVQDVLVWKGLTSIDRVNYQSIANQIKLQWESWRIPPTENYANEYNATHFRGYLRDEVYSFEIAFLLKNGKQTDSFHIPGRRISANEEILPEISNDNPDYIDNYISSPYWKIYNTATVIGFSDEYSNKEDYKGPYQYGEFAYWESSETYPCNKDLWGELAGKPIRHHKFPDVAISPIFESKEFINNASMQMGDCAIFPLGIKIDDNQIETLILNSSLTKEQKDDIIGWKIVRGDRGTNKSIVAKGILRNVNSYTRENQTYLYPNYPYNDLNDDPFLTVNNNAFIAQCEGYNINIVSLNTKGEAIIRYTDCNTNKSTFKTFTNVGNYSICSIDKPTIDAPAVANIGNSSYEVWEVKVGDQGCEVGWIDPIKGYTKTWLTGRLIGSGEKNIIHVVIGSGEPERVRGRGKLHKRKLRTVIDNKGCSIIEPLPGKNIENLAHRQIFNSPETSFGQPFLGNILKLENVIFGVGKAHFVEVKNNAKYKLLTKEVQTDALLSAYYLGKKTNPFNPSAFFAAYQGYIEIFLRSTSRKNFAYSYNSVAEYNYSKPIENNLGIKQRKVELGKYIIPGVQSVGDDYNINNYQRETSVFLKTEENKTALPLPNKTESIYNTSTGLSITEDKSRYTISELGLCNSPSSEKDISVLSYYASIKNNYDGQWGQIYSYDTIDTGYQKIRGINNSIDTIFGGDTFIGKFAFKTKLPFFLDNRVGAPDDSDIYYDEIGNVAYPKYWHSARSITDGYFLAETKLLPNIISYKAHNFDCPNTQGEAPDAKDIVGVVETNPNRVYYDGYFYLFAYGIPNFYCESSYNVDLRQAFNNKEGDFYPHVSKGIPDNWLQETNVTINQDNTYYYNTTYSKQNKENTFTHLPIDWESESYTKYPFRAIYSEPQNTNADAITNNWLTYRALSYYDFPKSYGKLVSLDGIQNRAILARFENKSLLYNNLLTIDTSNPQSAYVGNPNMFSAPPIDFAETDLGYVGSQHKFLLKIPEGQVTIDAKRGQVFIISGTSVTDISGFGSGMNRFLTDNLDFEILKYFPDINIDNNFKDFGLHGVYDSKFDRVIITKLDYIPLSNEIKYNNDKKYFYINEKIGEFDIEKVIDVKNNSYFCNRSWTLSYSINLRKWISFHSYIPNFYIAENNFFYSGINGESNDFEAIAGEVIPIPSTTTTTTNFIPPFTTTTTTTKALDCNLEGEASVTDCEIDGIAIITVPPSPPECVRPKGLSLYYFATGYIVNEPYEQVVSTSSKEDALEAAEFLTSLSEDETNIIGTYMFVEVSDIRVGNYVYVNNGTSDCAVIPNGWYFTEQSAYEQYVFNVVNGVIVEIYYYSTTTTTTTSSTTTTTTTIPITTTTTTTIMLDCTIEGTGIIITPTTTTTTTIIGDNLLFKLINPLNSPAEGYISKNNYEGGPYLPINTSGILNGILNTGDTFSAVFKNNSTTQTRQVRYLLESSIRGILYNRTLNINVNVHVMSSTFTKVDGETITITLEVLN